MHFHFCNNTILLLYIKLSAKTKKISVIGRLWTLGDPLLLFRERMKIPQAILTETGTYAKYWERVHGFRYHLLLSPLPFKV